MTTRPRLTPAIADVRRAVREALAELLSVADAGAAAPAAGTGAAAATNGTRMRPVATNAPGRAGAFAPGGRIREVRDGAGAEVLVALSGGADSLALAAATAFEAPRAGLRAGAVVVDHGLQEGSADIAERAAAQARELGLDPVIVRQVEVGTDGGPEASARKVRYAALATAAAETGARVVLIGHTLDDQAETVLLGLARGSGPGSLSGMASVTGPARGSGGSSSSGGASGSGGASLSGMASVTGSAPTEAAGGNATVTYARPLLGIRRVQTLQFCVDSGITPWQDPQNRDAGFARVRVRETVLPVLERELGPGIAEALARTAELAREDAEALDHFAQEQAEELADHAEAGLSLSVKGLASNPAALRQRIIRLAVSAEFGVSLSRAHTLEVARLVTDWRGQGALHLPGIRVVRQGGLLVFSAAEGGV